MPIDDQPKPQPTSATRPPARSARVDVRDRRQVLLAQRAEEQRTVGGGLSLAGVRAVLRPAHPATGAEGLQQQVHLLDEAEVARANGAKCPRSSMSVSGPT